MNILQSGGERAQAALFSESAARAMLRSRANLSRYDDELTAQQMLAPEQSPVITNLLAIARRDLAELEKERNAAMRAVYHNSPQKSGLRYPRLLSHSPPHSHLHACSATDVLHSARMIWLPAIPEQA